MFDGRQGEALLESVYGATVKGVDGQVPLKMDPPVLGNGRRVHDVVEDAPEGKIGHETKVGNDPRGDALTQCRKDGALLRQGKLAAVHWHFFAYGPANSIGADQDVLACLQQEGLRFSFHRRHERRVTREAP